MRKIITVVFIAVLLALSSQTKSQSVSIDTTNKSKFIYKIQLLASKVRLASGHKFSGITDKVFVDTINGVYKYSIGSYTDIAEAQKCLARTKSAGYKDAFIKTYKSISSISNQSTSSTIVSTPIVNNAKSPVVQSTPQVVSSRSIVDSTSVKQSSTLITLNPIVASAAPVMQTSLHADSATKPPVIISEHKDSTAPKITFGGYVDAYYAYYTDSTGHGKSQKFGAISPYSNNFGLNIAQITGQYSSTYIRSTVTIQYGDLPTVAWSPVYNYIQEANAGVRIFKNFWLDAGFFKTHIGTEALLPKDNICSSVSAITFYEPWWQSGMRLSWTGAKDKLYAALYIVNGYNTFVALNNKKAAGLAITYNFSDKFNIGYYDFMSDNTPDSVSTSHWRFLNNFVINMQPLNKLSILIGGDYIVQQNVYNGTAPAEASSLITSVKYQCFKKIAIYGRLEMFNDPQDILTGSAGFFHLTGETFGIECKPVGNSFIRLEGRNINMAPSQIIFETDGQPVSYRREIMLDLGVWF